MKIKLGVDFEITDADEADVEVANEITRETIHDFTSELRKRLEAAGVPNIRMSSREESD